MKLSERWARRVKRRLERAGFKVTMLDPALALESKKAARRGDLKLLAQRRATPAQLQRRNSLFARRPKSFRIVNYGGLEES
jgi:hypothetical protein